MKKLKLASKLSKSVVIALLAIALITGGVFAAWMLTKSVGVSLTIVPSGDLVVSPSHLDFGTVYHTTCGEEDIEFQNTTEDVLTVDWDAQIKTSDNTTLIIVGTTGSAFELAAGMNATRTITFNVDGDAPYGEYSDLVWNVYGELP